MLFKRVDLPQRRDEHSWVPQSITKIVGHMIVFSHTKTAGCGLRTFVKSLNPYWAKARLGVSHWARDNVTASDGRFDGARVDGEDQSCYRGFRKLFTVGVAY